MAITVVATFHPAEGQRDALLEVVLAHVPAVRAEVGCLAYAPHTVGRDGLLLIESWDSGDDLKAHGDGPTLAALNAAAEAYVSAPVDVVVARPVPTETA
jgi:quinol monooxygenase YgiN